MPHITDQQPHPATDGPPTSPNRWRQIALGFALGCLVFVVLRGLGTLLLQNNPCQGRTLWALLAPLILGPGGIAYATTQVGKGRGQAALGVGLALSSLFPALAFGVRDIGVLRTQGCAGGYIVFSDAQGGKLPQLLLHPGQQVTVLVRPSGFADTLTSGPVTLKTASDTEMIQTSFVTPQTGAGVDAPLTVQASAQTPSQQYTLTVTAQQGDRQASGQLTVTVRP